MIIISYMKPYIYVQVPWNHIIVYKILTLDKNTWYHIRHMIHLGLK